MTSLGEWEHNIIPDTIMSSAMGILGTPELFRKSRGKGAIGVRAIVVLL